MDCSIRSELTLNELSQEQLARLGGRRYPFAGSLELTERCNLACVHCYINQPAASGRARARELSTAQIASIVDQVAAAGCLFLLLTGGEILLRPDFPEVYRHAARRGILLTLFTNGTLLTPRIAGLLAEWRPRALEVTLYGATEATYERVTRVPGSYARCLAGIERALAHGLPLALKTVLLRSNRDELQAMKQFAAGLGLSFRYDAVLWPRLDEGSCPPAERLSPREIIALDESDPERSAEWRRVAAQAPEGARRELVYACGAGRHSFHIDCSGRLSPCIMARIPAIDLLHDGFAAGWEQELGIASGERCRSETACRTCRSGALCAQCPGWSQIVHGDNETPVAFVCELGRLRAAHFSPSGT